MVRLIYSKYDFVARLLASDVKSVLDVGCRDGILRTHLSSSIRYTGVDLEAGPAVTRVCNVEQGLPFADGAFDAVVALDLLEHTDNIWYVFDELVRVARRQVIVVLPNLYHWSLRLRFLAGKEAGKYVLPPEPIVDRHRWLTSYRSSKAFCQGMAQKYRLRLTEFPLAGGRRTLLLDVLFSLASKNLGAWAALFAFERIPLSTAKNSRMGDAVA